MVRGCIPYNETLHSYPLQTTINETKLSKHEFQAEILIYYNFMPFRVFL